MSLMSDVQKFIETHPGCTSSEIADAFADFHRQRVLQSASKLRQSERVAHRFEGKTCRHFPHEADIQPVPEAMPIRNDYAGSNDPRVILRLTRKAEALESRGLFNRASIVWLEAFSESQFINEREEFLRRRQKCLNRIKKRTGSAEQIYLAGRFVGDVE
ncbi:PerC family transcriptional regulator [Salmonella enterica subsp. enterica serovar Kokomlemle]